MKKFFLIPLMTLMCSVMAWAADVHVSTYADLKNAVENGSATTIYLDQDIEYRATANNTCINITRDLTIDGQGHTLTGYAGRNNDTNGTLIALNHASTPNTYSIDVTIKNFNIIDEKLRAIETRSNVGSLTIENCTIKATKSSGYQQPITIGGNQSSAAEINIINSNVEALNYYPIITFNPVNLTITDSRIDGWCSVYFKGPDGSAGAHGSTVVATNSYFNAQNYNHGLTNTFGAFVLEDDDVDIVLDNCVVDVTAHDGTGVATQALFLLSDWATDPSLQCRMTIKGSNSHVIGDFILVDWDASVPVQLDLQGGSYYGTDFEAAMAVVRQDDSHPVSIATGYHAEQVNQGGQDIYRIVKDAAEKTPGVKYDLNDDVPTDVAGEGNNPSTSFELSIGGTMELDEEREVTTAGYVQVKDNENSGIATIVKVGTTETADPTQKVDQTLIVNNGLDVQGDSKVEVQAGSALVIGEGGIVTSKPENIVILADEDGAASLLLEPTITVNQNPELTVKMTVPAEHAGYQMNDAVQYRHWFRFAVPVKDATTWTKTPNVPTYLYGWDYAGQQWAQVSVAEMDPFYGYTLSPDQEIDGSTSVTYTFKGKLLGNEDCKLELNHHGYNFFGNSYTGYISVLKLVDQIIDDSKIDGTVWMWDGEKYEGVALSYLKQYGNVPGLVENWKKEVAPMQTFVLRLTGSEFSSTNINYADAIWGNPRYTSAVASAAPARNIELNDNAVIRMTVSANNHKQSVTFIENNDFSDEYNRGYDAIKYMNENSINMYVNVNGENYGTIATDNIEGKTLSLRTTDAYTYTLTFDFAAGEEYALRDNVTGAVIAIENGVTYEFAAQPNSTIEGRFEIVAAAKMPTAIENTEVKANVKGIYTIMGQYLGEDFEALPAGVYVVDGVKIVK